MKVIKKKPTDNDLKNLNVFSWPQWTSDIKRFNWEYSDTETCYFLEGKVVVETDEGKIEIEKGDLVQFPKGLKCVWDVKEPVKKHYYFGKLKI